MLTVFLKVMVMFIMIGIGFMMEKIKMIPYEQNKFLIALLLNVTTPCLLLSSLSNKKLDDSLMHVTVEILVGSFLFFIIGMGVSYVIIKLIKYPIKEDEGVLMCALESLNTGFMGLPITKSVFGKDMFFLMIIENVVLNIYMYILSLFQINYGSKTKVAIKGTFKAMLNNCNYAIVIGMFILFARIEIPEWISELFTTIGDATIAISMFVVGIQLSDCKFKQIVKNRKLLLVCLINIIGVPLLCLLCVHWLPIMNETKLILVFSAAFPCAVAPVAVADKLGKNSSLLAQAVAVTTSISIVTLPCFAVLVQQLYL